MRILMRAQMEHDKSFSHTDVFLGNLMGGNSGNWLYQYSLYRALMYDETVKIDTVNFTKIDITKKYIKKVNEKYDVFVLPLANAFKTSFRKELKALIAFISKLEIPVIVIGIGIQCSFTNDFSKSYEDSALAKKFVKEVLKRSRCIGVRGESTAEFLENLGFRREKDFTVIGCPSMYMHGIHLPEPKNPPDPEGTYILNSKVEHENKKIIALLKGITQENSAYYYIPQRLSDILKSYYGIDYRQNYITAAKSRFFDSKKAVCFNNVPNWISFIKKNAEFSIGTRLHGNVASVLAGVPAFILANDRRVEELAQYHNIPHIRIQELLDNPRPLNELLRSTDFTKVTEGHADRFNHFVDFLEMNGLKTAYTENRNTERVYFDTVIEKDDFTFDERSFACLNRQEAVKRTQEGAVFYADLYHEKCEENNKLSTKIYELKKELKEKNRSQPKEDEDTALEYKESVIQRLMRRVRLFLHNRRKKRRKKIKGSLQT